MFYTDKLEYIAVLLPASLDSIKDRIPFTPIMLIIVLNSKGTISYAINTDLSRNGSSH